MREDHGAVFFLFRLRVSPLGFGAVPLLSQHWDRRFINLLGCELEHGRHSGQAIFGAGHGLKSQFGLAPSLARYPLKEYVL